MWRGMLTDLLLVISDQDNSPFLSKTKYKVYKGLFLKLFGIQSSTLIAKDLTLNLIFVWKQEIQDVWEILLKSP